MWCAKGVAEEPDSHVAFRGHLQTTTGELSLNLLGASEYMVWLDGKLVAEGPPRFTLKHPEYQNHVLHTTPGSHVLAVHVHHEGVSTSQLPAMKPFLWCQGDVPIEWRCTPLPGYRQRHRRVNEIQGWIDWLDTRESLGDWQAPAFDDSAWPKAEATNPGIGDITAAKIQPVRQNPIDLRPIASGKLTENYGYEGDPAVRFFLRDLDPKDHPAQGVWRRYDLGRVRLGRPDFTLDLPAGATVEFALCEELRHGRGHPFITLSGSPTCNLDHYIAKGGPQEFLPILPKGGRFLEVHVLANGSVKFLKEGYLERTYYGDPQGSFDCGDALLNKIWKVGVDTVRACSDDALTDCPTRERAEWTGDVASVATDICAVAWSDLSLSRKGLVQPAQGAREDGLVAGVGPGQPGYLSTYAAQWATACYHYFQLTGDKELLQELWPAAERNIAAFEAQTTADGVKDDLGWAFVDWGYVRNEGPSDMALNLHYLRALRSMIQWQQAIGASSSVDYEKLSANMEGIIRKWINARLKEPAGWHNVGFHRAALALLSGLVQPNETKACVDEIKKHLLSCFPNDPNGPRLSDPGFADPRVMTPYFGHFAMTALLEHGETDFVLGQYRKCWGWALTGGYTTWLEVFDTRWSHCHEWSGCPTWQLSRFVLGLRSRFDLGENTFDVKVSAGSLTHASGDVPLPTGGVIHVKWTKSGKGVRFEVRTDRPIHLRIGGKDTLVTDRFETTLAG